MAILRRYVYLKSLTGLLSRTPTSTCIDTPHLSLNRELIHGEYSFHGRTCTYSGQTTVMASETSGDVPPAPEIEPRGYQLELLAESIRRNIIIALDTGSGKTHVAILRMKHEVERGTKVDFCWRRNITFQTD